MIQDLGISNAADRTIQETATGLPSARSTLRGRFQSITLGRIVKTVVDKEIVESQVDFICRGSVQPATGQELKILPEGQRAWDTQMLHTTPEVSLRPDEVVRCLRTRYRVVGKKNFSQYGTVGYLLQEDYDRTNPAPGS